MADIQYMAYKLVKYSCRIKDQLFVITLVEGCKSKALHYNLYHRDITPHSNKGIRHKY